MTDQSRTDGRTDRTAQLWAEIDRQSGGEPVSVAHVCIAALAAVNVDGAGLTVMTSPTVRETVHTTDQVAGELEEWQLTFGQGPCVDAFSDGATVLVGDLRSRENLARWPVFGPAALRSGALAVFALPLQIGAIRLGVLDLYRIRPGPLSSQELTDALVVADTAAMLLLDMTTGVQPDNAELAWQRDDPTVHQVEVHQATGMMVIQLGVDAEAAFARLRAFAYSHDQRLADVARDVVDRRLRFDSGPSTSSGPPTTGHDGE